MKSVREKLWNAAIEAAFKHQYAKTEQSAAHLITILKQILDSYNGEKNAL